MQVISKIAVDLIFCSIVAFLIIQGSSTTQPEENSINLFGINSIESSKDLD